MSRFAFLTCFVLILSSIHNVCSQCPPNASFVDDDNGICYDRIFTPDMTWHEARAYCESSHNGGLLDITSSFAKNSVETWLSDPTSVIWIGGYTADYTFSKDDENHTDILLGNMSGDSNVTTPSFTIPVPNGFLLDQYAIWFWANRQNSTSIFENQLVMSHSYLVWGPGQPTLATGACLAWRGGMLYALDCDTKLDFICEYPCGGSINTGEMTAITANYEHSTSTGYRCVWEVDVGQGRAILELETVKLTRCCDRLTIYESANSTTPLYTISDETFPAQIISSSNTLYITYSSHRATSPYGFGPASSSSGFNGTVRGSTTPYVLLMAGLHGVITTSNFPELYTNNHTNSWVITVDKGVVNLIFTDFDVQPGTSTSTCDRDRLEVREDSADGQLLTTLCGSELPSNITSSTGSLYLKFATDSSVVRSGFRAIYRSSAADCVHIWKNNSGELKSLGYDTGSYPSLTQCTWYIDVIAGLAKLTFDNINTYQTISLFNPYCTEDDREKLVIYDGIRGNTTLISKPYCSFSRYSTHHKVSSGSRYLTVHYTSNNLSSSPARFHGTWRSSTNCSQTIRKEIGSFTSPEYPDYYEPLTNCTWLIDVISGNATLQLRTFGFMTSETCSRDRFQVHDGNSSSAPQVPGSPFCGSTMPDRIVASSQYLFVHMYTDGGDNAVGFIADFWSSDTKCHMWGPDATTFVYKDRCYGLIKSTKDWYTARTYCEERNTSLLYIESREEFDHVSAVVFNPPHYSKTLWTGGYRRKTSNWLWSTLLGDILYPQLKGTESWWAMDEPGSSDDAHIQMRYDGLIGVAPWKPAEDCWFVCKEEGGGDYATAPPLICYSPPSVAFGRYNPEKSVYTNGTTITVKCHDKYRIKDTDWLTCNEGHWQGFVPVCELIPEKLATVPYAQNSDERSVNNKDYTTVLAVTLTIICLLVLAIVVGVVWFVISRRRVIPNQPLVEMH